MCHVWRPEEVLAGVTGCGVRLSCPGVPQGHYVPHPSHWQGTVAAAERSSQKWHRFPCPTNSSILLCPPSSAWEGPQAVLI